jgi:hypothetical protein
MKRLRIVSNGEPSGTKIFDADTGEAILNATRVAFEHDARKVPRITVEIACIDGAEIEIEGDAEIRKVELPATGSAMVSSKYAHHRPPNDRQKPETES